MKWRSIFKWFLILIFSIVIIFIGYIGYFAIDIARSIEKSKTECYIEQSSKKSDKRIIILSMNECGGHKAIGNSIKTLIEDETDYAVDIFYRDKPKQDSYYFEENGYENLFASKKYSKFNLCNYIIQMKDKLSGPSSKKRNEIVYDFLKDKLGNYKMLISVDSHINSILYKFEDKIPKIMIQHTDLHERLDVNNLLKVNMSSKKIKQIAALDEDMEHPLLHRISMLPVHSKFLRDKKPRKIRRKELGLPDKPMVLVMFGSCGSYEMEDIMEEVGKDNKRTYVFICGKNKKLYEDLCKLNKKYGNKFIVLSFVHNIHHWMQAASCMLGKAGGATTPELIACKLPIIMVKRDKLGHEWGNTNYLLKHNIARLIEYWDDGLLHQLHDVIDRKACVKGFRYFKGKNQMNEILEILKVELDEVA